jgi:membrane peptidoglycan carboxypeptidase
LGTRLRLPSPNQRGRVSNPEYSGGYESAGRRAGRHGGGSSGSDDSDWAGLRPVGGSSQPRSGGSRASSGRDSRASDRWDSGRPASRPPRPTGLAGAGGSRRDSNPLTSTWERIQAVASRPRRGASASDDGQWQSSRDGDWDDRGAVTLRTRERPRGLSAASPSTTRPTRYNRPGGGGGGGGWDGRGRRPRRKGDWWRRWTWKKALAVVVSAIGVFIMLLAGGIGVAYSKTPIPTQFQEAALNQASTVYFADGKTVIGKFGSTDRQVLTYQQIPALVKNAVVAAEDKNFWHEGGISPTGIVRAAYYDLTNSGGNLQGGSTITQQLVRNYYQGIGSQQTASRKIKEIFVAEKLAKAKSKQWILTTYLNTVYFGNGAYGIGAAAQTYFGIAPTQLKKLTPAQAAMIAAMIQSPSYFNPDPKSGAAFQGLKFRWQYVLKSMVSLGVITAQQEAQALQKFPAVVHQTNLNWGGYRGYLMNRVRYELETVYGYSWAQIENDGLRITTTVGERMMRSLRASVKQNETLMKHNTPPTGIAGGVTPDGLPRYVNVGALLEDPSNGAILAMYSGPNYNHHKYDNALQSRNQVGSSFKPYVLATAVHQGMNVRTSRLNGYSPLWIPPDSQPMTFARPVKPADAAGWYQVSNDEVSNPNHPVSVTDATALSLNTAYTDLWHRVAFSDGQHNVVNMAKAFGVDVGTYKTGGSGLVTMEDQSGTALGQASLTVAEQASMIATLADMGTYHTQHMVAKIVSTTAAGTTQVTKAKVESRQVLTQDEAADVDYAMSFDTTGSGTAAGLGLTNGQTVIAKTGTTNLAQSAFFLGATQRDAMAIGLFVNKSGCPPRLEQICKSTQALSYAPPPGLQTLFGVGGLAGYGGQWPAIIWHDFFMKNFNGETPVAWPPVNDDGTAWNLVGKFLQPKPKHKHQHQPQPGCHHHSRFFHFCHTPTPGPTPSPSTSPSGFPSPTPSPSCHGGPQCQTGSPTPTRGGASAAAKMVATGAAAGAPLAALLIVIAGPSLPLVRRLRPQRRNRQR